MGLFVGAATIVAYSVTLTIVPLLPAFAIRRQLLRGSPGLAQLEARGFTALGCRRVYDLDLDLAAQLGLVAAVGTIAAYAPIDNYSLPPEQRTPAAGMWAFGAFLATLTVLAGFELLGRCRARRTGAVRSFTGVTVITCVSLWLVWVYAAFNFIYTTDFVYSATSE